MGDLHAAFRRTLPLLAGLAALYLACWLVIRAEVLAHAPHVLAYAITADLTLSATLAVHGDRDLARPHARALPHHRTARRTAGSGTGLHQHTKDVVELHLADVA